MKSDYRNTWIAFVQIGAEEGQEFMELIDSNKSDEIYSGAWANVLLRADTIGKALDIIPLGLKEKGMKVLFIDKIENVYSLAEYDEIDRNVLNEVDWLLESDYVFMISDKLFPYL